MPRRQSPTVKSSPCSVSSSIQTNIYFSTELSKEGVKRERTVPMTNLQYSHLPLAMQNAEVEVEVHVEVEVAVTVQRSLWHSRNKFESIEWVKAT